MYVCVRYVRICAGARQSSITFLQFMTCVSRHTSSRAIFFSSTVSSYFRCLYCCSSSCLRIFPRVQFGVTSAQVKRSAKTIINITTRISCVSVRKERGEERGALSTNFPAQFHQTGIEFDRQRNRHHQQPESEQFTLNTDACCKSQMITHVLPTHTYIFKPT